VPTGENVFTVNPAAGVCDSPSSAADAGRATEARVEAATAAPTNTIEVRLSLLGVTGIENRP
jgi:hypothetical protein